MNLKNYTADLEAKATLRKLLWLMEVLPSEVRKDMIEQITEKYCGNCGHPIEEHAAFCEYMTETE